MLYFVMKQIILNFRFVSCPPHTEQIMNLAALDLVMVCEHFHLLVTKMSFTGSCLVPSVWVVGAELLSN